MGWGRWWGKRKPLRRRRAHKSELRLLCAFYSLLKLVLAGVVRRRTLPNPCESKVPQAGPIYQGDSIPS